MQHPYGLITNLLAFCIIASFIISCNRNTGDEDRPSLEINDKGNEILQQYRDQPEQALKLIDSAENADEMDHDEAEIMRAKVYSRNEATLDEAREILEQLIQKDDLTESQRYTVLENLVYVSRARQDDERMLKYGPQLIEISREFGYTTTALTTQSEMGTSLVRLGRIEEGLAKINDAIAVLDGIRRFTEMDACILAMKSKIRTLNMQERYEEVIPVGKRIVAKLKDYDEHPEEYADQSSHLPLEEDRPKYIDFYTNQAYAFIAYAYCSTNQLNEARKYCHLFEQSNYGQTFDGKKLISSTWCLLGDYDKMLDLYSELKQSWGADTMHHNYATMLYNYAMASKAKGDFKAAAGYYQRYASLMKKLNNADRLTTAQEYAARYHEQEQQAALEQEQASRQHIETIATFLGILAVVVIVFVVFLINQLNSIRTKNKVLTKEIAENISHNEKLADSNRAGTRNVPADDNDLATLSDGNLFEYLSYTILAEKLFLKPDFGRQQLIDRFHLTKERIGAAFSKGSQYQSLSAFLNEHRLIYATKLLSEHAEMPITDVAAASGFASNSVFSRNFKQRYALTPSQFREERQMAIHMQSLKDKTNDR